MATEESTGAVKTIGLVINMAVKPSREIMFAVARCIQELDGVDNRNFYGSPATTARQFAKFVDSGVDGLIVCGFSRRQFRSFMKAVPNHPPMVLGAYCPIPQRDMDLIGCGGIVMPDNEQIGRLAADFFRGRGFQNYAFLGSNLYRENVASELRRAAFESRLRETIGDSIRFETLLLGHVESNEDCWDEPREDFERWLKSLPLPCGIFVNGGIESFVLLNLCKKLKIDVPSQIEVLGMDHRIGFFDQAVQTISGIRLALEKGAQEVVRLLLSLIENPDQPKSVREIKIDAIQLDERSSTASGRGYGLVVERAKEYIRVNACSGIAIKDIAKHLGVSRRLLELRVRESLGQSVLSLIQAEKLKEVCRLLTTTNLTITNVTTKSGYSPTGNLGILFKKTFGMSMREYRKAHSHVSSAKQKRQTAAS